MQPLGARCPIIASIILSTALECIVAWLRGCLLLLLLRSQLLLVRCFLISSSSSNLLKQSSPLLSWDSLCKSHLLLPSTP